MRILRNAQFRGIITHMLNIRVLNKLALVTVVAVAATLFWEDGLSVEAQAAPTQYAWTFETVAHAGPIEGTCTPDTRVTRAGLRHGRRPGRWLERHQRVHPGRPTRKLPQPLGYEGRLQVEDLRDRRERPRRWTRLHLSERHPCPVRGRGRDSVHALPGRGSWSRVESQEVV